MDSKTIELGKTFDFETKGYSFDAKPEEFRKPKVVRVILSSFEIEYRFNEKSTKTSFLLFKFNFTLQVAAVQHSIVKPTTDKLTDQRDAIFEKVTKLIQAAAASNVNIICFQEAWSKVS